MMRSNRNIMLWVGAFFCFNVLQPVYIWSFASLSNMISLGVILLLCIINIQLKTDFSKAYYIIVYVFLAFISGQNILSFLGCALLFFLMLAKDDFLKELYDKFITVFVLFTTVSLVVFFLVQLRIPIGYSIINPLNSLLEVSYKHYPFLVVINTLDYYRFMGLFDEPGVMGTLCSAILLMKKFDFTDRRNILILIFGIFSFSLVFYVVAALFVVLFAPTKYKIITVVTLSLLLFALPNLGLLDQYIFARLNIANGKFVGDDRLVWDFDESWYERYKHSSDFYWGLGREAKSIYNSGGSSYIDLLIMYGLIFTIFYSLAFIVDAFKRIKPDYKNLAVYLLIFISIMYQRPYITNIGYVMMLYIPIIFLSKKKKLSYERK